jgi:hypothetical protein
MQIVPMRQEFECSRMKDLRCDAPQRGKRAAFRLSFRRR